MKLTIVIAALCLGMFLISWANAREIGFVEDFGLAKDRSDVLKRLIPGTSKYYYYHCLHAQHTGNFEQVREMLELWIKREGYTQQVKEILNRQALLEYEQNSDQSLAHIRKELGLDFDHRRELATRKTDDPTMLDPERISFSHLRGKAFSRYKNLQGIEDAGLDHLDHRQLSPERRRDLLQRLARPDIPDLAKLVVEDLRYEHSHGFGSFPIHRELLKSQLDECVRLMPELMDNAEFIRTYLPKLAPGDETDLGYDRLEKRAYLDRLWAFASQLAPAHNSLKAHILFQILDMDRAQGNYDHNRFVAYVSLPRNVHYMNPQYMGRKEFRHVKADMNADFPNITLFPPIGTDEELVRDYLSHFFVKAKNHNAYIRYVRDTFLKPIFAETKIVNGIGDMEQWYSMLEPAQYQALKDRTDLEFAQTNKKFFSTHESVTLDLHIKNISTLIVKIFELNTFNYYQAHLREVDTAVNLDGLVATHEIVISYDDPNLRRVRRTFEFPEIKGPGVFVVEFIGNGKSSRAVIRKGKLHVTERIGPAGHEFTVWDETNQKRPQASIWLAGREYAADEDGLVIIPFTHTPGPQTMILRHGPFCSLASFDHLSENYRLSAGFYVDRESLLTRCNAKVIVRPVLSLNGHPISLSLLEDVRVSVESTDRDDVSAVKEISDFELFEDKDAVFEFQTPENLSNICFTLRASVRNVSKNKKEDLNSHARFSLNRIDTTLAVEDMFLSHVNGNYVLEVLGKNGEPKPHRPMGVELKHRHFRERVRASLQTDDKGRVHLGKLEDIEWVRVGEPQKNLHTWYPAKDLCRYPARIHARVGDIVRVPYVGSEKKGPRLSYALFETRGNTWLADHEDAIRIRDGFLEISGLPAGNYDLFLKQSRAKIRVCLTSGEIEDGFVVSEHRVLEMKNENMLHISNVNADDSCVTVRLGNPSEFARVHLFATHFMPMFHAYSNLAHADLPDPCQVRVTQPMSQYVEGRNIGDEYRYILDRKYAEKFPGNMLDRPELLLNPWSIRKTETTRDEARAGDMFDKAIADLGDLEKTTRGGRDVRQMPDGFSTLDFLARGAAVLVNLKPDPNGVITIPREDIGDHQQICVIAVDPFSTVYREISLPETKRKTRDLRLARSFDADKHVTEQKQISLIRAGETFSMADITTSEFEVYDTLDRVWRLLGTLSGNPALQEFRFIPGWPELDDAEKQEKYSKHACHELSFFLYHKDRTFFDRVILPYLRNKKDKTFLDHWLLGDDLDHYLEPWAYSQLNIVEKILLARGGPGDQERTGRYIKDMFDLMPLNVDEHNRLFDTALKGSAFEQDAFGVDAAKEKARKEPRLRMAAAQPVPPGQARGLGSVSDAIVPEPAPAEEEFVLHMDADMDGYDFRTEPGKQFAKRLAPRREARKKARPFFRKLDKTKEWVENNYYHLPAESQNAALITVNAFWNDFAQSDPQQPFLSKHVMYAFRNFAEIMLAVSVLDLPFKSETHESEVRGITFTLTAASPMILFHKEIRPAAPSEEKAAVLANQQFFRPDDRYRYVGNERVDKFVEHEFLVHTAYGCQFVLSNPTSSRQKVRVLLQIPQGAMPLNSGFHTKGLPVTLDSYSARTFEYHFYFPEIGEFGHYPVQVAKNEQFVTCAAPSAFDVVEKLTRVDTESWEYVSQEAEGADVLEFLRTHNLNRIDLNKIAFRMKARAFFDSVLSLLRERHTYHHTLWSYSIYHNEPDRIFEYLRHSKYASQCGLHIDTPILSIDPVERKMYQHKEYRPLVNARAHQLGSARKILNNRFYDQYHQFMKYLSYRGSLDNADLMSVTYYLLVQDRVSEAMAFFERIDPGDVRTQVQYDYLRAYLDFYTETPEQARHIVAKYSDCPVPRWQNLFQHIADQLDELDGKSPEITDKEDRDQIHASLADSDASFEFTVASGQVRMSYQNLTSCQVNYYPMDIELLFSRNPFVRKETGHFAFIRPNETHTVDLAEGQTPAVFDLPEKFHNSNLMIEIVAKGIHKSQAYYANALDVQIIEGYGHLKVAHQDTHQPLPKVYVKVYARMKRGEVQFFKDGYTDLRGRFDYVSLNTNELDHVEKFALLVLSEDHGAMIREASPPKR